MYSVCRFPFRNSTVTPGRCTSSLDLGQETFGDRTWRSRDPTRTGRHPDHMHLHLTLKRQNPVTLRRVCE